MFTLKKIKSIMIGIVATFTVALTAIPVSAWDSSGEFYEKRVDQYGYVVLTLNQTGYRNAELNISAMDGGIFSSTIHVDVYTGRYSHVKDVNEDCSNATWDNLDPWSKYGMDMKKEGWGYRIVSGDYSFS